MSVTEPSMNGCNTTWYCGRIRVANHETKNKRLVTRFWTSVIGTAEKHHHHHHHQSFGPLHWTVVCVSYEENCKHLDKGCLGVSKNNWIISLIFIFVKLGMYSGPPLWSSGQSFWLQVQRSRVRSPALPDFLSSSGSGTGSTRPREPREVNWGATWMKKVAAPGLENRD